MQKFYRDKSKLFECNISVDGAKLNETKARLILEFPNNRNLLFHGNIDSNGKCEVTIPPLKEMDETEGEVLLEIIAESTHFESWRDKFKLETNKKVQVEMVTPKKEIVESKITPRVQIITESVEEEKEPIQESKEYLVFKEFINESRINLDKALNNKTEFLNMLAECKKKKNLTKKDVFTIFEELKKRNKNNKLLNS
jgi:hypothetical protein